MVAWAVRTGDLVLEPSAGHGRIAAEILKVTPRLFCNEVDPQRAAKTEDELGVKVICSDFLKATPPGVGYDAVVINPPFSKGQEARHILHAMKFLRPGGRLAAIASAGVTFRETALYKELREALAIGGKIEELPAGTFSKEGTDVSTVLITWTKP
jgi:16S rRNA G1207 methylase RsmC